MLDRQGHITQQCTPEELSDIKLDLERSEDDVSAEREPGLDLELPDEILEYMAAAEVEDVDGDRRVGDAAIYAYFISVAGWWYMVLYVILYAAFVFGLRFPGKSPAPSADSLGSKLTLLQLFGYSGGPTPTRSIPMKMSDTGSVSTLPLHLQLSSEVSHPTLSFS